MVCTLSTTKSFLFISYLASSSSFTMNQKDMKPMRVLELEPKVEENVEISVSFSHIHLYVDKVDDITSYKSFETRLNRYNSAIKEEQASIAQEKKKSIWQSLFSNNGDNDIEYGDEEATFIPQNRDVIRQLLAGVGFRVTGYVDDVTTRTALVSSRDPNGVQILVSAVKHYSNNNNDPLNDNIIRTGCLVDKTKIKRFMEAHQGRQGIAVLAFNVNNVKAIYDRYLQNHPKLIDTFLENSFQNVAILEVFAYYQTTSADDRIADPGTVLRFVQFDEQLLAKKDTQSPSCTLLGINACDAVFDSTSMAAYCDHWVSNVFDRTEFIDVLHSTLGFIPKVDFNAGVVAAGEAQIESTVIGNTSKQMCTNKAMALTDQSQVYLPINNALSSVGHVHGYLQEIGQGVQHVASRVENLVKFVQRSNEYREVTGEGFTFLRIPRSYYGILTPKILTDGKLISEKCANAIIDSLQHSLFVSKEGALDLFVEREQVARVLDERLCTTERDEYLLHRDSVLRSVMSSRYLNLYNLLGDSVSEEEYLGIVRNQILVDIQGGDLLYQIFTSNILQRNAREEAPFFEYIQRVCSKTVIKPGCGGFGIRNFLTLFLSIEVSKAMEEVIVAQNVGDFDRQKYAQTMVDYFTDQMNESNPILTEISEAMTDEGECLQKLSELVNTDDEFFWRTRMESATERKNAGNLRLMECSSRYNELMKRLRESR